MPRGSKRFSTNLALCRKQRSIVVWKVVWVFFVVSRAVCPSWVRSSVGSLQWGGAEEHVLTLRGQCQPSEHVHLAGYFKGTLNYSNVHKKM